MPMDISQNSQIQKRCTADVSILIHLHLAFIPMRDFLVLISKFTIDVLNLNIFCEFFSKINYRVPNSLWVPLHMFYQALGTLLGKSWAKQLSLSNKEKSSLDEQLFQFKEIFHFILKSFKHFMLIYQSLNSFVLVGLLFGVESSSSKGCSN